MSAAAAAALGLAMATATLPSWAEPARTVSAEAGPHWSQLTPAQRSALAPLERDWSSIDADRKQKWLQIAGRMPGMPPAERERVQTRMTEWARLSPQQRGQARLGFQQANQAGTKNRKADWEAYQALSAEQKRQLQARAVPPPPAPRGAKANGNSHNNERPQLKSNIVPNPSFGAAPKTVGPTVVQAQPGATTSLISRRATPPSHEQTGLPKIAATPEFVDKRTLLPRRGPQAAATRSAAAASAPEPRRP
ncbi:MAG TPA: DUF3106 domain-containing protein [Albitalea sp.]|nr:DUF3106 domain-containing protein [Albitalea sp.]